MDTGQKIAVIRQYPFRPAAAVRFLFGLTVAAATLPARAQTTPPAAATATAAGKSLTYDVVSIKPHPSGMDQSFGWRKAPEGFSGSGIKPQMLIVLAYGLHTPDQIVNLPAWASTESFDIKAKTDEETAAAMQKLSDAERDRKHQQMIQAMLADRFGLKIHRETRQLPVYDLVVAKGGPKMKVSPAQGPSWSGMSTGYITGQGVPVATLVFNLSNEIDRPVVDKTGLTGNYDFKLTWTPAEARAPADPSAAAPDADSGPSIFSAIEEQLGLKLVSAKGPVDVIVVDHVERPSEN